MWPFKRQPARLNVIRRSETRLRLHEFRSEPSLVATARRVCADPDFQMILQVLKNEHPGNLVIADDAHPNISVAIQRRAEGYTMCLANLEAMTKAETVQVDLEATWEDEVEQTEKER